MSNVFGPIFLVLSSATSLKKQITSVHKLILPLLSKLEEHFFKT